MVPCGHAQSAHFSGSQVTLPITGLNNPRQVAADAGGNLYIADSLNNRVLKETLSNGSYTETTIGTGLNSPLGVAVDVSGNVYIADSNNGRLLKETLSGSDYSQTTVSSTVGAAWSVAVDASGNIFVADSSGNRVLKETPSGSSYVESTIGSGLSLPSAVAVDASGNVYIGDRGSNQVFKETLTSGSYVQSTVVSGLSYISSVAVDSNSNVFVAIYGIPGDPEGSQILKETPSGNSYTQSLVGSTAYYNVIPIFISLDANGDVLITNFASIAKVSPSAGDFGAINVGSSSSPVSLIFTFDSAGTIARPSVLTQGTEGLDFTDAGTGSCTRYGTSFPYTAGVSCTVDVLLNPKFPGSRYGAVVLRSTSGNLIATGYAHGSGLGPQINFPAGNLSKLSFSNVTNPYAVTSDPAGNLYIAQALNDSNPQNAVIKQTWTGSGYTQSVVATNLRYPVGVAVDGAGNVYVADQNVLKVFKYTPLIGGGYAQSAVFSSSLGFVEAVTVDGSGNVYIGNLSYSVLKETLTNGTYVPSQITGSVHPRGVAVDEKGNVYVTDAEHVVMKQTLSNGGYTESTIASDLNSPHGVAVDGNGNVYIAETSGGRVVKYTLAAGSYSRSTIASNLPDVLGVAVDGNGNVFASSASVAGNSVWKVNLSDAPNLTFATTTLGSTSSAQAVTVQNVGNAALSFPIPASGNNPSIATNFSLNSTGTTACPVVGSGSSNAGTLAAGASCQLSVSFAPTAAGNITGSLVLTDNNLNAVAPGYVTQSIALSGTALELPILTFASIPAQTYGNVPFTVSATSTSTGAITYSVVSGRASISGTTVTLTGAGTVVLSASQAASGSYGAATVTTSFTVVPMVPMLTFATIPSQTYGNAPFTVSATSASNGAITYSVVSGPASISGATVTLTGAGTVVISASQAASGNYGSATGTTSFVVMPMVLTLTFAAIPSQTYGNAPFTVSATSASAGAVTYSVVSGPAKISGATVTLTGAGTVALSASQAASGNYAAATATTSFNVAAQSFTLSAGSGSTSATTTAGGTATYTLSLSPGAVTTFPNAVNLSVSGIPTGATATFSPTTLPAGSGLTSVTLTIQTSKTQTARNESSFPMSPIAPVALGLLLLPIVGTKSARRRLQNGQRLLAMLALVSLSLGAAMGLSGCAGNGSGSSGQTTPKTYTMVVTATDATTGAQGTTNLTLTVQ
ncbi:choice-of-anchor D domain-containing protein [Terriglobus sp. TAA 43]|uniref:choice-of-anchor D domain-containing protein n=1 Tax=Terriglobus sp. TAA 43 TaxID=278961 RepID=UPI001E2DE6C5|nr:choice-of-anchor D domain-containing protein [Terriglobus sp. TAA 43]